MEELLREMHAWMRDYMKSFYTEDAEIQQAIRMKEVHTGYVTAIAKDLAKHLGLTGHDADLAEIMGLFHDVGRFRQYAASSRSTVRSTTPSRKIMRLWASRCLQSCPSCRDYPRKMRNSSALRS